jgi:DNA-directed RNA polymerase subunit RPC12/RpoP
MGSSNGTTAARAVYRCNVCGREFADAEALEHHVRDQGLLW